MTDEFDRLLWAYRAVFKQTNAGGGNIQANLVARERMVVLYGVIGPDDYAANRTVTVRIRDEDGNTLGLVMSNASVDNKKFVFPVADFSVVAADDGFEFEKRIVLGKGDSLTFIAASLVQNEELTITLRALFSIWPPSVNTTGSGGTVTTTEEYNKVI